MSQVRFAVKKHTAVGEIVFIVGSIEEFGYWKEFKAQMTWCHGHEWVFTLNILKGQTFEYKYALLNNGQLQHWEKGENRVVDLIKNCQ